MGTETSKKVMLVEDDPTMKAVLQTLLDLEGYQVFITPDRKSAGEIVELVRQETPDVILLDVHLRGTSGMDIVRLLRQDSAIGQTQVVMSSGMDMQSECLRAGANSFLLKPYMPDELIAKLRGESTSED